MNLIIRFSYLKNKIGNDQSLNITARIPVVPIKMPLGDSNTFESPVTLSVFLVSLQF